MSPFTVIILFFTFFDFVFQCSAQQVGRLTVSPIDPDYKYPQSYKDMVYTSLSKNAQELFFAINIHPSCLEKKGQCIPRGKCIEKKMLYISRVCYTRDLVCCYVETLGVPEPLVDYVTRSRPTTKKSN